MVMTRATTTTRSRPSWRSRTSSPAWTGCAGLTRAPLTRTCPARQALDAAERVLASRTDQSQLSTRPVVAPPTPETLDLELPDELSEPGRLVRGRRSARRRLLHEQPACFTPRSWRPTRRPSPSGTPRPAWPGASVCSAPPKARMPSSPCCASWGASCARTAGLACWCTWPPPGNWTIRRGETTFHPAAS